MKEALYSLEDKGYAFLMQRLGELLAERDLSHAVVGGAATQLRVVGMICRKEEKPLEDLILTEQISERQNLRRTNDIDIIIHDKPEVVLDVIKNISGEIFTEKHIYVIKPSRVGQKRPRITVDILDEHTDSQLADIALNISYSPKDLQRLFAGNYYPILYDAERINFTYEDLRPSIMVAKSEHIIATKLSRYSPKDQFDIASLVDLHIKYKEPLNVVEIGGCLGIDNVDYIDRFELFKTAYEQRRREFEKNNQTISV